MTGLSSPRPLNVEDVTDGFNCGEPALNEWLQTRAKGNQVQGASQTFVTVGAGRVVGYYCLSAASVQPTELSSKARRNMPKPIPAVLLGRLAVDASMQRRGLGSHLVRNAIERTLEAADIVGIRVLLVHAISEEAAAFYEQLDFERSPTDELHLFLLLQDARAARSRRK